MNQEDPSQRVLFRLKCGVELFQLLSRRLFNQNNCGDAHEELRDAPHRGRTNNHRKILLKEYQEIAGNHTIGFWEKRNQRNHSQRLLFRLKYGVIFEKTV